MDFGIFELIYSLVIAGIGCIIGILTFGKNAKKDNNEKVKHETRMDVKLDNIAKNVDEIRLDNKDFTKTVSSLGERVTAVEQSTKQAHKRIDNLEELHLQK